MSEQGQCFQPASDRIAAKVMDGEAVIIDLESGVYYSLSDVGGRIWELLEGGCSVERIALEVQQEYGVAPDRAVADVRALFARLVEERLVVDSGGQPDQPKTAPPRRNVGTAYTTPVLQVYRDMQDLLALDPPMPGLKDIPWQ